MTANNEKIANLRAALSPKTIALIGGRECEEVMIQCRKAGYQGEIWPVHPKRDTLDGKACFRTVKDLPAVPDAAFVAIPREPTIAAIADLADMGCKGVVCYASGFAEVEDGAPYQERLLKAAGDMAVIGPNCYGAINYLTGATLWPDQHGSPRAERGVAIVTQSGNMAINMSMQQRDLPIAFLMSIGNQAQLSLLDCARALADDDSVTAIGLHIEGLKEPGELAPLAAYCRKLGKPIVALKTGRSSLGAEMALRHTASMSGSGKLYDALFKRCGVGTVTSVSSFLETLKLLHVSGPLKSRTLASMSCSGGEAALVADMAEERGLSFPDFSPVVQTRLEEVLGPAVHVSNPLDYHTYIWADYEAGLECYATTMEGDHAITLLIMDYPNIDVCSDHAWLPMVEAAKAAKEITGKHLAVVATMPESFPSSARKDFLAAGITPLQGLDETLEAVRAAADIGRVWFSDSEDYLPHSSASLEGTQKSLSEWQGKELLRIAGVAVPKGCSGTSEEVLQQSGSLNAPLVAKATGADLAHKSELGAVKLNLSHGDSLSEAVQKLSSIAPQILVEEMVTDCVAEFLIGATIEPGFGPYLVLGAGGVLVELLDDNQLLLLPCSETDVWEAIAQLKIKKLLDGYRGKSAGDLDALVDLILKIAKFVECNLDRLVELDINPVMVRPTGQGAVAVDALIVMKEEN